MRWAWLAVVAPLLPLSLLAGCSQDVECICDLYGYDGGYPYDGGTTASGQPMLVQAETGKTLVATPGDGVGVFVQYATGGHWTVFWTCDTNKTDQPCDYVVDAVAKTGKVTNIAGYDGTTLTPSEGGVAEAGAPDAGGPAFPIQGMVTNQTQGISFDTDPGATIEITATLNGAYDGTLFYFVDQNKVKDGYKGQLSDPLDIQPTQP